MITINESRSAAFVAIDHDNRYYVTFDGGIIKIYDNAISKVGELKFDSNNNFRGIAIDNHNRVMFVASANNQIMKATLDGEIISSVGAKGSGELQFHLPMGLCLTRDGLLLVADYNNKRVEVLGSDLSFVRFIPCLSRVYGVSVDDNGNIHAAVTDCGVEVFSITGEKIAEYGRGLLIYAADVAFLPYNKSRYSFVTDYTPRSGKMYIFDWSNNILIHTIECGVQPVGVAISQEGSVILCHYNKGEMIYKF